MHCTVRDLSVTLWGCDWLWHTVQCCTAPEYFADAKGVRGSWCFLAHALSVKMAFVPKSRSTSNFVKLFQLLAGAIWMGRHISRVGLTLYMNTSSGISSFVIFLWFLIEELSPGLMSLASPLGDPSDSKVEFEIILLSVESSLSLISSTDRMLYLLLSLAHPDWCFRLRLFPTLQPGFHNPWTRLMPHPKTFLVWAWTNLSPCHCLLFPCWCFYSHPRRLCLLLSWHCEPNGHPCTNGSSPSYDCCQGICICCTAAETTNKASQLP